jgi:ABC-type transport system substrate-binding protein
MRVRGLSRRNIAQGYMMRNLRKDLLALAVIGGLAAMATPAAADDLEFTLTNATSVSATEFYVSPTNVDNWENNLLDGKYLPAGNEVTVTIGDGRRTCTYDIRTIFEDGRKAEDTGIDLCQLGKYTVHE